MESNEFVRSFFKKLNKDFSLDEKGRLHLEELPSRRKLPSIRKKVKSDRELRKSYEDKSIREILLSMKKIEKENKEKTRKMYQKIREERE